jgi:hypothetical protein
MILATSRRHNNIQWIYNIKLTIFGDNPLKIYYRKIGVFCKYFLLNHITYIDKQLWESSDNTLKQQILSDAQENNNKAIVTYDVETDQKEIIP